MSTRALSTTSMRRVLATSKPRTRGVRLGLTSTPRAIASIRDFEAAHRLSLSSLRTMKPSQHLAKSIRYRKDLLICPSCCRTIRLQSSRPNQPSRARLLSHSSKTKQNATPTMEQLRQPFKSKNASTMYYTLSIILGTVAFSYGSVPMYKMVRFSLDSVLSFQATES